MNASPYTTQEISLTSWVWLDQDSAPVSNINTLHPPIKKPKFDILRPLRQWLDKVEVRNSKLAHQVCKLIPAQCPFERDVCFMGCKLFHIPPMCKLNPLYEEVVSLRFRALCYLADECGEDVSLYC
ncbi:MAG TPA: nitrogenase [Cyanobacteria bacterium UBA11049]|nr:nitrogenase [Cyanobacteria bacterium UBA11049]